jgi:RNA polymerase sigma-70 factor (ECF subfamily)
MSVAAAVLSMFVPARPWWASRGWPSWPGLASRALDGTSAGSKHARASATTGGARGATSTPPPGIPTLAEIFREHAPFVWRGLRRLGIPESDVEDVCQEVFVVVHRKLGDFEGRSSLRTWIYGICARTASDYRRSGRVRREVVTDAPPEVAHEGGQHDAVALRQARATLDRILDELDDDKRSVFVLYEIEELTMAEVAEALGCPLQTAYSRLHAARKVVEAGVTRAQHASANASAGGRGGGGGGGGPRGA